MARHNWTYHDNEVCCRKFMEYYIINHRDLRLSDFVRLLKAELPDISENSLKWKVQNIKYLSTEAGMKDSLKCGTAEHCSPDNIKASYALLGEYGLK